MKKIFLSAIVSFAALGASAQNAYDATNLIQNDLNGSARYVGMGGALNALGADISTMSSNPASTGLYRKSDVGFTFSALTTGEQGQLGYDRSKLSFDQAGIVFAFNTDNSSDGLQFVNLGINYRKSRNFFGNVFTNVANLNNAYSQTMQIADLAEANWINEMDQWGLLADVSAENHEKGYEHPGIIFSDDEFGYYGIAARDANYRRHTYGGISEVDLNMSFNVSDRFYYGLTLGIYDIDYSRESFYEELGVDNSFYDFSNWFRTTGSAFDLKLGFICRPIEESPFRFGIALNTPTWYKLTDANGTELYLDDQFVASGRSNDFDYKLTSPWKVNLSLGHTIGNKVALGAEYEFAKFNTASYGSVDNYDAQYMRDVTTNRIKPNLKTQHTLKLGVEYKPVDALSLRLGYNYVSSPIKKDAYNTILYFEPTTDTDYTNWKGLSRITCGAGYRWKSGYVDVAYLYQMQKGDFYAFDHVDLLPTSIKNNRGQFIASLGFRF